MKSVLKIRSFDSLKKLNYKRARGKKFNLLKLRADLNTTIITLDNSDILDYTLLAKLVNIILLTHREERKLDYVIRCRIHNENLSELDCSAFLNLLVNTYSFTANIPYQIQNKYKNEQ